MLPLHMPGTPVTVRGRGRGVPGVVEEVGGWWEGYTRYPPSHPRVPYLVIFEVKGPTHGRMKAILMYLMRFLRLGPE